MNLGREYKVVFEKVSVTALQDLFQIIGATGKISLVTRFNLASTDVTPTSQNCAIRVRFLPATVTNGSGGSSPTPQANPGDSAASFTAKANNTTPATTSGTAITHLEDAFFISAGYSFQFPTPIPVGPSESAVIELLNNPSGTITLSGTVWVTEIGG